jgi:hypothetical protein
VSTKRTLIDKMYLFADVMKPANGYVYTWGKLKSMNNGTFATKAKGALLNVKITNDNQEGSAGQNKRHMTSDLIITGLVRSVLADTLENNDLLVQQISADLESDIINGFDNNLNVKNLLCPFYCYSVTYKSTDDSEVLTGDSVKVEVTFEIKWYETRKDT